jgi:hypothetical protein
MPEPFTDNNGTTFVNQNVCRSFNMNITTSLRALSGEICSEVLIINKTGANVTLYDQGYISVQNGLLLADGDSIIMRGVTHTTQISAVADSGTGLLYYRSQYFSNTPSR